jgi:ribosomal protein S18 acetylase RimI-like enzyme
MIQIKSLSETTFDELYSTFSEAFADYEIQISSEELKKMLNRRGYESELSFGAFDDDRLVSFTFNGIGVYCNKRSAYDTGTGTLPDYRGRKLAGEVFNYSLPFLRESGIQQYVLEVLKHNQAAISVYTKQGFKTVRDLLYFTADVADLKVAGKQCYANTSIFETTLREIKRFAEWHDFEPSWQNSFESVERSKDDFLYLLAFAGDAAAGYLIFEPVSGDITQIAVNPLYRRLGIATLMLKEAIERSGCLRVKCINTDENYPAIKNWTERCGITLRGGQFEMVLSL